MQEIDKEKILAMLKKSIDFNSSVVGICAQVLTFKDIDRRTFIRIQKAIIDSSINYQNEIKHILESEQ